jgi:hypothetical protein
MSVGCGLTDDATDYGVKSGRVTATSKYCDLHRLTLLVTAVAIRPRRVSMLGGWPEADPVRTGFAASDYR